MQEEPTGGNGENRAGNPRFAKNSNRQDAKSAKRADGPKPLSQDQGNHGQADGKIQFSGHGLGEEIGGMLVMRRYRIEKEVGFAVIDPF